MGAVYPRMGEGRITEEDVYIHVVKLAEFGSAFQV